MVTKNTREYTRHKIRSDKAVSDVKINSASLEDDVPFPLSTVGEFRRWFRGLADGATH
jgi:hypothetical protein